MQTQLDLANQRGVAMLSGMFRCLRQPVRCLFFVVLVCFSVAGADKTARNSKPPEELSVFRNNELPDRTFRELEILTDDGHLSEEEEIVRKFIKRAKKLKADALIVRNPIDSGAEFVPFQGFKKTYLFKATAIRFTGPSGSAASSTPTLKPNPESPPATAGDLAGQVKSTGTGFFITADGYLVTNEHVVREASSVSIRIDGKELRGRIVKTDPANDLAVLKVDGAFPPLAITSSKGVKLGDNVITIGYPLTSLQGLEPKLTKGEISGLSGLRDDLRQFQISNPVQPGNSGGPLVDTRGNVVGIVVARLNDVAVLKATGTLPQNVNYAVKSAFLRALLETIPGISDDSLPRPRTEELPSTEVVSATQAATVMVLVR